MESINWEKCARPDGIRGKVKISLFPPRSQISSIIFVPWFEKEEEEVGIILEKIKMINFRFRISRDKNIRTKHWKFLKIPLSMKF